MCGHRLHRSRVTKYFVRALRSKILSTREPASPPYSLRSVRNRLRLSIPHVKLRFTPSAFFRKNKKHPCGRLLFSRCGDGRNRTAVHMMLQGESTRCSLSFDLSARTKKQTKHTRAEVLYLDATSNHAQHRS